MLPRISLLWLGRDRGDRGRMSSLPDRSASSVLPVPMRSRVRIEPRQTFLAGKQETPGIGAERHRAWGSPDARQRIVLVLSPALPLSTYPPHQGGGSATYSRLPTLRALSPA